MSYKILVTTKINHPGSAVATTVVEFEYKEDAIKMSEKINKDAGRHSNLYRYVDLLF